MRALIDHVERGPVSLNAWSRRRAVPKVCAALRRRDPFEDVGRRRSREVTAHDEAALAAVRVGDAHYEQARTAVCGVPNVVMRQWKRAGSEHVAHQAGDNIGNPADGRAGLLVVRVAYSDGSEGSLVVSCNFAGTATADVLEGVTASKGRTDFWNPAAPAPGVQGNRTAFHVID